MSVQRRTMRIDCIRISTLFIYNVVCARGSNQFSTKKANSLFLLKFLSNENLFDK